jgi:hypothetical protein
MCHRLASATVACRPATHARDQAHIRGAREPPGTEVSQLEAMDEKVGFVTVSS